jgi:hypothetical protein
VFWFFASVGSLYPCAAGDFLHQTLPEDGRCVSFEHWGVAAHKHKLAGEFADQLDTDALVPNSHASEHETSPESPAVGVSAGVAALESSAPKKCGHGD